MRKGKMAAQAAHASMKVFFDRRTPDAGRLVVDLWPAADAWVNGVFAKIVVSCDSEAELLALRQAAEDAGLPHALIQDSGATEFHGVPTYTALAVGPADAESIDRVTGHLKLL
jgi:PTH2 family peptidyl-tRNA hydrolase